MTPRGCLRDMPYHWCTPDRADRAARGLRRRARISGGGVREARRTAPPGNLGVIGLHVGLRLKSSLVGISPASRWPSPSPVLAIVLVEAGAVMTSTL